MNADRAEALTARALVHLAKGEMDRAEAARRAEAQPRMGARDG